MQPVNSSKSFTSAERSTKSNSFGGVAASSAPSPTCKRKTSRPALGRTGPCRLPSLFSRSSYGRVRLRRRNRYQITRWPASQNYWPAAKWLRFGHTGKRCESGSRYASEAMTLKRCQDCFVNQLRTSVNRDMTTSTSESPSLAERVLGLRQGSFPFASKFLDVSGARVHYVDEGAGPVLLLLHGNPTWSYVCRQLIMLLRTEFRCIAPDLPGFSLSTAPLGYEYLPQEHARVIAAFVDTLDLRAFTPVVQDWGGPIGLYVAGLDPNRVERLVIGNTWSWPVKRRFSF